MQIDTKKIKQSLGLSNAIIGRRLTVLGQWSKEAQIHG